MTMVEIEFREFSSSIPERQKRKNAPRGDSTMGMLSLNFGGGKVVAFGLKFNVDLDLSFSLLSSCCRNVVGYVSDANGHHDDVCPRCYGCRGAAPLHKFLLQNPLLYSASNNSMVSTLAMQLQTWTDSCLEANLLSIHLVDFLMEEKIFEQLTAWFTYGEDQSFRVSTRYHSLKEQALGELCPA